MIRSQSNSDECYEDRNLLIQLLAAKYQSEGKDTFFDIDQQTNEFVVICIVLDDQSQLSWHIPKNEILIDLTFRSCWKPMDVLSRRDLLIETIKKI